MPARWLSIREGLRATAAIPRMRLFEQLDRAREQRLLWLVGEDGLGKSTLIASYVARRGLHCLWLDMTPGDADLGCFLAHLSAIPPSAGAVGGHSHDSAAASLAHARAAFKHLLRNLPRGTLIVLDGLDRISAESGFALILREALDVTPEGIQWCAITGEPADEDLAYLVTLFQGHRLGPSDLRVDADEVRQLLPAAARADADYVVRLIHENSAVIGSVVAAIAAGATRGGLNSRLADRRALPFQYLDHAQALLTQLPESRREAFLALSLLRDITPDVFEELILDGSTLTTLKRWARHGLFVHHCLIGWRFHPRFREMLNEFLNSQWSAGRRADVLAEVARFCERHGRVAEAVDLYNSAQDWNAVAGLIQRQASTEIAGGQASRVRRWIEAVPDDVLERMPMLRYWLGRALAQVDDELARLCFMRARDQFERQADALGWVLSQGGILDVMLRRTVEAAEISEIVVAMDARWESAGRFSSRACEIECLMVYLRAALWSDTAPGGMAARVRRLHELTGAFEVGLDTRLCAATCLLEYAGVCGHRELAEHIVEAVTRENLGHSASVLTRSQWVLARCAHSPDSTLERASLDTVIADTELEGSRQLAFQARLLRAHLALNEGRHGDALDDLRAMQGLRRVKDAGEAAAIALVAARVAHAHHQRDETLRQAVLFLRLAETALPRYGLLMGGAKAVTLLMAHSAFDLALQAIGRLEKRAQHLFHRKWQVMLALLRADLAVREGDDSAVRAQMERVFRPHGEPGSDTSMPSGYAADVAVVMAYVLERGLGGPQARKWIKSMRLPAPAQSAAFWPWRARIRALGETAIAGTDEVWRTMKDFPPLLVQLLLAGPAGADKKDLLEQLYPKHAANRARSALTRDLALTRTLLGDDQCIRSSGRRVCIDRGVCWVDIWAFDELADRDTARALVLYKGRLLAGEAHPDIEARRAQLHERYVKGVNATAQQHELQGRHDTALALYQGALEVDGACEPFYQGVMRCELRLGHPARARQAYDLLTQVLASHGGMAPSSVTHKILDSMQPPAAHDEAGLARPEA